ncbi:Hsp20/alpha crystallin family protein [Sphaerotilaceae bacterium SBD11-9]
MNDIQTTPRHDGTREPARQDGPRYGDASLVPPVDVFEDGMGITLFADLPGVSRDQLKLHVDGDTLSIEAETGLALPENLQSNHTEVGLGRFHRVFTLSKELDTQRISAELTHGVLKLCIPKAEHAKPRRIEVKLN